MTRPLWITLTRTDDDTGASYRAVCGAERVDPAHELATTDRARVTCRACLRKMARQAAAMTQPGPAAQGGERVPVRMWGAAVWRELLS